MTRTSISSKLALVAGTAAAVLMLAGLAVVYFTSRQILLHQLEVRAGALADQLNYTFEVLESLQDLLPVHRLVEQTASQEDVTVVAVIARDGTIMSDPQVNRRGKSFSDPLIDRAIRTEQRATEFSSSRFAVADPLRGDGYDVDLHTDVVGVVWIEMDLRSVNDDLMYQTAVLGGPVVILIVLTVAAFLLLTQSLVVRRLHCLQDGIDRLESGDLSCSLLAAARFRGGDEIDALIQHFVESARALKARTEDLARSERSNRAILDASPDMFFRLDQDGHVLDFRASDERELVVPMGQVVGSRITQALPPEVASRILASIGHVIDTGNMQITEYQMHVGLEFRSYEARLVAAEAGEVLAIVRDVTEHARLEQMRSDFLHSTSHELRTPLAVMLTMADLIQEGGEAEELQEYWDIFRAELARQQTLIEDLLLVGRIEHGIFVVSPHPVDIRLLLLDAARSITRLTHDKHLQLQTTIPDELPLVNGDERGLEQVIRNLLTNAVKYTPTGGEVSLSAAEQNGGVSLRVRDTGMGIAAEELPHVFERYFRAQNAISHNISGTGMGLFIVNTIVDALNGNMTATSTVGVGSTFEVWLPQWNNEALHQPADNSQL